MEEVKEFFKVMTSQLKSKQQGDDEPCSSRSTSSAPESRKRKPNVLPSSFLKKKKQSTKNVQTWDKEIVLFPKDYTGHGKHKEIPVPRGEYGAFASLYSTSVYQSLLLHVHI